MAEPPHIVEWWGGEDERPTLDEVLEHYSPEVLAKQAVVPYIAMLDDEPIGYAQSYIALGSGDGWWEDETDPGVRGIDQSLANPSQLNKGLGTKLVRSLVELLFSDPAVTKIQTDPSPSNHRAIRCYEKAGFVQEKTSSHLTALRCTWSKHAGRSKACALFKASKSREVVMNGCTISTNWYLGVFSSAFASVVSLTGRSTGHQRAAHVDVG